MCTGTERTYEEATITKNISLSEGVQVLKGLYLQKSYNSKKYFTLGGCSCPE